MGGKRGSATPRDVACDDVDAIVALLCRGTPKTRSVSGELCRQPSSLLRLPASWADRATGIPAKARLSTDWEIRTVSLGRSRKMAVQNTFPLEL